MRLAEDQKNYAKAILVSVAIAGTIYAIIIGLVGFEEVRAALARINGLTWFALLIISLASFTIRFLRWDWVLRRQKCMVPRLQGYIFYLSGFALTTTPGKVGETIRLWYLRRAYGILYSKSAPIFVFEQILDVLVVTILSSLAASVVFPDMKGWLWVTLVIVGGVALFILIAKGGQIFIALLIMVQRRLRGLHGLVGSSNATFVTFRELGSPLLLILSILVGFVAWSLPGIGLLVILFDLGFVVSPERAIGIFSLSLLAGVFSIFSGGLGTTEAALGLLLLTVGVDPPLAVAAAIISRVSTLWFAVALGSLMLMWSVSLVGARGEITQARHKA